MVDVPLIVVPSFILISFTSWLHPHRTKMRSAAGTCILVAVKVYSRIDEADAGRLYFDEFEADSQRDGRNRH